MEDTILKEIKRICTFLVSLIEKLRIFNTLNGGSSMSDIVKLEMRDKLNIDLDAILENGQCAYLLVNEYGFNDINLDNFAEILYNLSLASKDNESKCRYISNIKSIYSYLDTKSTYFSFSRYDIEVGLHLESEVAEK